MKITFSVSHNGKSYNSIQDAVGAAIQSGIKDLISEKLRPFNGKLNTSEIIVNQKSRDCSKYEITVKDVPDDIRLQVEEALSKQ